MKIPKRVPADIFSTDKQGNLCIDTAKLLRAMALPNMAENQAKIAELVKEIVREQGLNTPIVERWD